MTTKKYEDLSKEEQKEYLKTGAPHIKKVIDPLIEAELMQDLQGPKTEPGIRETFIKNDIYFSFSGTVSKIEKLLEITREAGVAPLTVKVKGTDVLLSMSPFLFIQLSGAGRTDQVLDAIIEDLSGLVKEK